MVDRVVVFLDYQNVYHGARESFHPTFSPPQDGQIDPRALGELIVGMSPFDRELIQVRLYRGQPDSTKDPKGYGACSRQIEAWRRLPGVRVISRSLRYPVDWPRSKAQEKGIDVALAVDFVLMAVRGEYDVGVIMSTDTDLKPALEAVIALRGNPFPRCELAAWSVPGGHSRRLSTPGTKVLLGRLGWDRAAGGSKDQGLHQDLGPWIRRPAAEEAGPAAAAGPWDRAEAQTVRPPAGTSEPAGPPQRAARGGWGLARATRDRSPDPPAEVGVGAIVGRRSYRACAVSASVSHQPYRRGYGHRERDQRQSGKAPCDAPSLGLELLAVLLKSAKPRGEESIADLTLLRMRLGGMPR